MALAKTDIKIQKILSIDDECGICELYRTIEFPRNWMVKGKYTAFLCQKEVQAKEIYFMRLSQGRKNKRKVYYLDRSEIIHIIEEVYPMGRKATNCTVLFPCFLPFEK